MRIKKFTCLKCGAPKVNPYRTPYVVCDYCGALTDIDFTVGMETWNESFFNTTVYQVQKMLLMQQWQGALGRGDRDEYYRLQHKFWDLYYKTFPPFMPPSIDTAEKYATYLEVCSVSSVEWAFDQKWQQYTMEQQQLQQAVTFERSGAAPVADAQSFFRLAEFFMEMTRTGLRIFYHDPRYTIMHDLIPEPVHFKMKLSMFVQAWLPYLATDDAARLLAMSGFKLDYVDIAPPAGSSLPCIHCKAELFAPEGSYKVYCEACRKMTRLKESFFCSSCGAPNDVPDDPGAPIKCNNCKTENRLIRPLFG